MNRDAEVLGWQRARVEYEWTPDTDHPIAAMVDARTANLNAGKVPVVLVEVGRDRRHQIKPLAAVRIPTRLDLPAFVVWKGEPFCKRRDDW